MKIPLAAGLLGLTRRLPWPALSIAALIVTAATVALSRSLSLTLNEALTLATGLLLLWYAAETYEMRRAMVRQNEISTQPVVLASIEHRQVSGVSATFAPSLVLRNIGRGPALFIRIPELHLTDVAGEKVQFIASFGPIGLLEPGKDTAVETKALSSREELPGSYFAPVASLDPRTAIESYGVVIYYDDVGGQAHRTVMQMGNAGIKLL